MFFLGFLLFLLGLLMVIKPMILWLVVERWKSSGATEPSSVYLWSTRFGGIMCMLAAMAAMYVSFLEI